MAKIKGTSGEEWDNQENKPFKTVACPVCKRYVVVGREDNHTCPGKVGGDVEVVEGEVKGKMTTSDSAKKSKWSKCPTCNQMILKDVEGEFYHKLSCPRSNGIGYGGEKTHMRTWRGFKLEEGRLAHHKNCECLGCK